MKKEIFIVVLLIIICCMGIEIYHLSNKKGVQEISNETEEVSNPIKEMDNEEIVKVEKKSKEWKIEGEFCEDIVEAGDPDSYLFYGDKVIREGNSVTYGIFRIDGNIIKIKSIKGFDPEGKEMDVSNEITEIEIFDERTLKINDIFLKRNEEYEDIKLSGNYSYVNESDAGWNFFEDGRVTFGTNTTLERGKYKTISQNVVCAVFTEKTIWDTFDTGGEENEEIEIYSYFRVSNDKKTLYILNEYTYKNDKLIRYGNPIEQ